MGDRSCTHFHPAIDGLEDRLCLNAGPSNVLSSEVGTVEHPRDVARTATVVSPRNLSGRARGTLIGLSARPEPGSGLLPRIVDAQGGSGDRLPLRRGSNYVPGQSPAQAFTRVSRPGAFSTGVTGRDATTGAYRAEARLLGDLNGDGRVTLDDLALFPPTYLSRFGGKHYDPAADANNNGFVGIEDGRALIRNLAPSTPPGPLEVTLALAPDDAFQGRGPQNSGGVTLKRDVTIVGRTTPGSLVFVDSGQGDYSFRGEALATDADGFFSIRVENMNGINQNQLLVIDPFGQQTIRAFPIFWMDFAGQNDR